ncbi:MAG: TolC family protein [Elusimicrobia bacterium]|nr:TolC family protein [Elusimicrobiota bacterium]
MNAMRFIVFAALLMPAACFGQDAAMSLAQYQAEALGGNHELREALLSSQAAAQAERAAFTSYFPKLSAMGTAGTTGIVPSFVVPASVLGNMAKSNSASFGAVTAAQPIFMGGRIVNGNRLAKVGKGAAEAQFSLKRNEVLSESGRKFRNLQVLEEKKKTLSAYALMLEKVYSEVEEGVSRGVATRTNLLRVKLKREEVAVNISRLEKSLELLKKDMRLYAGMADDAPVVISVEEGEVSKPAYSSSTLGACLLLRPEYALLQSQYDAARLQRKMKKGEYLPNLVIGASAYRADFFGNNSFGSGSSYSQDALAFGVVSVPLSGWWEASHSVKEMELKESAARSQLHALGDYLVLDIESKLKNFEESYDRFQLASIGLEDARANRSEVEDGYKNGTEKLSSYLEALALEQDSLSKLTEAKGNYFQAETDFALSMGQTDLKTAPGCLSGAAS